MNGGGSSAGHVECVCDSLGSPAGCSHRASRVLRDVPFLPTGNTRAESAGLAATRFHPLPPPPPPSLPASCCCTRAPSRQWRESTGRVKMQGQHHHSWAPSSSTHPPTPPPGSQTPVVAAGPLCSPLFRGKLARLAQTRSLALPMRCSARANAVHV